MVQIGYTALCEQAAPKQLVHDIAAAERAGFDFAAISDHYFPWLERQGHAPYAWSVLGAAAQATERVDLMTLVTCPTFRYHPAVVAQKAATVALLSDGRFALNLGAGENLSEHIVGMGWPPVDVRHERLIEAVEIIRELWEGGYVTYHGEHFDVESAKVYDLPERLPPIGVAVSGPESCEIAGENADVMVAVQPEPSFVEMFERSGGTGKPTYGQLAVSYDTDVDRARARAWEEWRWAAAGWKVMAELPAPVNFEAYAQFVTEDDIAQVVTCGPDVETHVAGVRRYLDAGFTHVALVQVGGDRQKDFVDWAERELLPALRQL